MISFFFLGYCWPVLHPESDWHMILLGCMKTFCTCFCFKEQLLGVTLVTHNVEPCQTVGSYSEWQWISGYLLLQGLQDWVPSSAFLASLCEHIHSEGGKWMGGAQVPTGVPVPSENGISTTRTSTSSSAHFMGRSLTFTIISPQKVMFWCKFLTGFFELLFFLIPISFHCCL